MQFDITSIIIGILGTVIIVFLLYRIRAQILRWRNRAQAQVGSAQKFIASSAEARYLTASVKYLNSYHIAGNQTKLSDIYVEPRFIKLPTIADPLDTDKKTEFFSIIPHIHDFPAIYAPYNVESLTVNDLRGGDKHLALLGLPGMGKSVALAVLGLMCTSELDIPALDIMDDSVFQDEIKDLPEAEREKKIQRRTDLQARALAQMKDKSLGISDGKPAAKGSVKAMPEPVDFKTLLPILVHLREIDLRPDSYPGGRRTNPTIDPAEPIVKALQNKYGAVAANTLPRMLYRALSAGRGLILIDGYDELAPEIGRQKLAWIKSLLEIYGNNMIIVAGPVEGYDALLQLKLTPIFLRGWDDADYTRLIQRWVQAWPAYAKVLRKPTDMPEDHIVKRVGMNNRGRLPLDVTLKLWSAFSGDEREAGRRGWYDAAVRQLTNNDNDRTQLAKLAAAMCEQNSAPLTREQVKTLVGTALSADEENTAAAAQDLTKKAVAALQEEPAVRLLNRNRILVDWAEGYLDFIHPLFKAFLAAESLANASAATVGDLAQKPAWADALTFASAFAPMEEAVRQRLAAKPDLLYSGLFSVIAWLPESQTSSAWRADIFKRLTAALLSPNQFPQVRKRAAAALVSARDKNVIFVFRQALRAVDPISRQLGCIGLGAVGDPEAIKDLVPMLDDSDLQVKMTAALALCAIGTEKSLEAAVGSMVDGDADVQRAVAESLAMIPGEGHAVLRDAMDSKDMSLRHAAANGLGRVRAGWAVALLYHALLEDSEWYVRNAAEHAFLHADNSPNSTAVSQPPVDKLPWLVSWAARRGEGVPVGEGARQVLIRALEQGEQPVVKIAAAQTLAGMDYPRAMKALYTALRDKDETVRSAAYAALAEMQQRLGEDLPAVN